MLKDKISIFEVCLRDGLQSEKKFLDLESKLELAKKLVLSGIRDFEIGSFVKEDRIPQLKETSSLIEKFKKTAEIQTKNLRVWAFVPNEVGLTKATDAGVCGVSFFSATSNSFCENNLNRTKKEILDNLSKLIEKSKASGLKNRVYLSTLVYCPFEGWIKPVEVINLVKELKGYGADEIVLSDTTGHASPLHIQEILSKLTEDYKGSDFALHLHDTRSLALTNVYAAIPFGLTRFDSSVAGLGGCPYAPGASGNLSTEDLVYFLDAMKKETNIDLTKLCAAGAFVEEKFGRKMPSKVLRSFLSNNESS